MKGNGNGAPSVVEREVLHQAHVLKTLSETPGWKTFVEMLQNRVDMEATTAMSRTETRDQVYAKEFAKGTFNGLRLAMELPTITIQAAEDIRMSYGLVSGSNGNDRTHDEGPDEIPSHPVGNAP